MQASEKQSWESSVIDAALGVTSEEAITSRADCRTAIDADTGDASTDVTLVRDDSTVAITGFGSQFEALVWLAKVGKVPPDCISKQSHRFGKPRESEIELQKLILAQGWTEGTIRDLCQSHVVGDLVVKGSDGAGEVLVRHQGVMRHLSDLTTNGMQEILGAIRRIAKIGVHIQHFGFGVSGRTIRGMIVEGENAVLVTLRALPHPDSALFACMDRVETK